jgi:glutamine synthetase
VVCDALGPHILERLLEAKRGEWREYSAQVHDWEVERYLGRY